MYAITRVISLFILLSCLASAGPDGTLKKMSGRLFSPVGDVKVLHHGKFYKVFDRFKVYHDDTVYLDEENASVRLMLYSNGSVMYDLKGQKVFPVRQFIFLHERPVTSRKSPASNTRGVFKPYAIDKVERQKVFVDDD